MVIEFYKKENGEEPLKKFLDSLPKKLREKTLLSISYLHDYGYQLNGLYSKKITDELWELRTKQSSDITRIMYFFFDRDKVILTHGFVKKTNKTPIKEIERAEKYRKDYYRRHK